MSVSIENFVKVIYIQYQLTGSGTRPGTLARLLSITNAAATDMARKLSAKNLVNYTKYKELSLTPKGKKLALNIIRRHRIWESYLYNTLKLSLHEIHREAEELEHHASDFLIDKIYDFLGRPSKDPHGDPIPDKQGVISSGIHNKPLSEAKPQNVYEISRLSGSDKEFFDFCNSNHLNIGAKLEVKKQYLQNKMTEIEINRTKILLNEEFTNAIHVKLVS